MKPDKTDHILIRVVRGFPESRHHLLVKLAGDRCQRQLVVKPETMQVAKIIRQHFCGLMVEDKGFEFVTHLLAQGSAPYIVLTFVSFIE